MSDASETIDTSEFYDLTQEQLDARLGSAIKALGEGYAGSPEELVSAGANIKGKIFGKPIPEYIAASGHPEGLSFLEENNILPSAAMLAIAVEHGNVQNAKWLVDNQDLWITSKPLENIRTRSGKDLQTLAATSMNTAMMSYVEDDLGMPLHNSALNTITQQFKKDYRSTLEIAEDGRKLAKDLAQNYPEMSEYDIFESQTAIETLDMEYRDFLVTRFLDSLKHLYERGHDIHPPNASGKNIYDILADEHFDTEDRQKIITFLDSIHGSSEELEADAESNHPETGSLIERLAQFNAATGQNWQYDIYSNSIYHRVPDMETARSMVAPLVASLNPTEVVGARDILTGQSGYVVTMDADSFMAAAPDRLENAAQSLSQVDLPENYRSSTLANAFTAARDGEQSKGAAPAPAENNARLLGTYEVPQSPSSQRTFF